MTDRIVVISTCSDCPHFDNEYYGYAERCKELGIKIERTESTYEIPEVCPLRKDL